MAGRGVRLLALLRARRAASPAGDVDQSELPPVGRGWTREEPARLGHSAGPPLPRPETVVPDSRTGRRTTARAAAPRSRKRAMAARARADGAAMASARAGAAADPL